jgi:hypothetical protein
MSNTDERERELRQMLAELQRSYYEAAKPIVDALVEIEMRKPPKPVIITDERLANDGWYLTTVGRITRDEHTALCKATPDQPGRDRS